MVNADIILPLYNSYEFYIKWKYQMYVDIYEIHFFVYECFKIKCLKKIEKKIKFNKK